ncbi:WhiB family transcriptional regulator [Frankia sp. CNm7]|uniref:Transcriptional regulator WhiB n=1 Tax=Frankia nepalensis TaxID=1836974 RepID=A0A937RLV7_9ACTN|nr:WhiB family transcriptional regulator [Frankia nepalensis]MBL7498814.1 WhiB family transcriptional regulator [Frankia nepalensis]MBL7508619.1 WhiB family transcriptional regulator [Frankia nepalensis]MBL7517463.1 WhiB family transcriptional regulator [Frankia nepalensis]MBL7629709.1 WhiB family transcriptional regulator [Frankia nepalensis]
MSTRSAQAAPVGRPPFTRPEPDSALPLPLGRRLPGDGEAATVLDATLVPEPIEGGLDVDADLDNLENVDSLDGGDAEGDLTDWRFGAACGPADVEIFYPPEAIDAQERRRREAVAKEICAGCPVRVQCLLCAVVAGERHGIWGGTTPAERFTNAEGPLLRPSAA